MTIRTFCAAATLATTAFAAPVAAETELSFNIFFPKTHFVWPVFQAWSDDIAEATDGAVRITFPAQSVSPPPGVVDAVRNGVADGGFIFNGFLAHSAPGTMVTQMPFISLGDSAAASEVFWQSYVDTFAEAEVLRGVEMVSGFHLGPTFLCSVTDTPITTLEELRERRVWALPGTIADTLAAMDLAITASPAVQVQELASRNTVDAHLGLSMETIVSFGVAPYTQSCVDMSPALQSANFSIFFNQRAWDRLSDDHRAAITDLSGLALATRLGEATNTADAAARSQLEAMGVTFAPIEAELLAAMRDAAAGVEAKWAEDIQSRYGIDGRAVVEAARAAVAAKSGD
ncbi:TRAP transporter substrate-binding protein DctP [Phaeobacter sp. J2-8]|uniref:TRAP transporter substrate-binding protein DctP n=1 Tax=Phaeobacter sp. J2-8 TaxID=2931394 RepID=UPI001FD2BEF9|nr:TRAP transporter substrate-binding protein DctP [Phaeobacter sp. J2-8]MCJ7873247.1 TRAP transporter substrate-binding protein DctP [Phaeobacter sp. J2-8]